MPLEPVILNITTNAGGTATVTHTFPSTTGRLLYRVDWAVGDLAAGVDAVLKFVNTLDGVDKTLLTLTNANAFAQYHPRVVEQGNTGADLTSTTMPLIDGNLQIAVTSGGNVKSGICTVWVMT